MCEPCRKRTRERARERKVGAQSDDDEEEVPLARRLELKKQLRNFKKLKLLFRGRTVASVDPRSEAPLATPTKPSNHAVMRSVVSPFTSLILACC